MRGGQVLALALEHEACGQEGDGRDAVAEQQPVEDGPGADGGAHDARVPEEPTEHDEAERGHHGAQQGDAVAVGGYRGGERGDGEGDGEIAALQHHDERQRDGRGNAGGEGAGGEPGGGRPGGLGQAAEAVGGEIEVGREHDREQRERDRAVELRHAQVGEDQRQQGGHDGRQRIEAGRGDGQGAAALQAQRRQQADGERGHDREDHEAGDVVGNPQHLGHRWREQAWLGIRHQTGARRQWRQERNDAGQEQRRAAGALRQEVRARIAMAATGEQGPLGVEAAGTQGQHREHR